MLDVRSIKLWKKLGEYPEYHVHNENAKTFITVLGFGCDEYEFPITGIEERRVSSKCLSDTCEDKEELIYNVVFLKYTKNVTEDTVKKTLTAKEIMSVLLSKTDNTILIAIEDNENLDNLSKDTRTMKIINIHPTDDFDCRSEKIKKLYKDYHTVGFIA